MLNNVKDTAIYLSIWTWTFLPGILKNASLTDLTMKKEGTGIPPRNYPKHPSNTLETTKQWAGNHHQHPRIVAVRFVQESTIFFTKCEPSLNVDLHFVHNLMLSANMCFAHCIQKEKKHAI